MARAVEVFVTFSVLAIGLALLLAAAMLAYDRLASHLDARDRDRAREADRIARDPYERQKARKRAFLATRDRVQGAFAALKRLRERRDDAEV